MWIKFDTWIKLKIKKNPVSFLTNSHIFLLSSIDTLSQMFNQHTVGTYASFPIVATKQTPAFKRKRKILCWLHFFTRETMRSSSAFHLSSANKDNSELKTQSTCQTKAACKIYDCLCLRWHSFDWFISIVCVWHDFELNRTNAKKIKTSTNTSLAVIESPSPSSTSA